MSEVKCWFDKIAMEKVVAKRDFDAQRLRADTAEAELAKLREAYKGYSSKLVVDALKSELAAGPRIAELTGELRKCAADLSGIGSLLKSFHSENESQWCGYLDDALGASRFRHAEVVAALNQKSEGESHE